MTSEVSKLCPRFLDNPFGLKSDCTKILFQCSEKITVLLLSNILNPARLSNSAHLSYRQLLSIERFLKFSLVLASDLNPITKAVFLLTFNQAFDRIEISIIDLLPFGIR